MTIRTGSRLRSLLVAPVLVVVTALVGCGASASGSTDPELGDLDPATAELEVRFQDSSVPPEYHRSYVVTVVGGEAHVVVDSYGDVIHDETVEVPAEVWASFLADVDEGLADVAEPEAVGDGCTGGTTLEVSIGDGGAGRVERAVEDCGSARNEEVADALESLLAPITDAIDLEDLTAID